MKENIRILHLSDIHYNDEFKAIKETLLKALSEINKEKHIDLICITGDLINKGGKEYSSIEEAFTKFEKDFIEVITKEIEIEKEKIFFVPGNHDVDTEKTSKYRYDGIIGNLTNEKKVKAFLERDYKKEISQLNAYKIFEKNFANNHLKTRDSSDIHLTYKITINEITIGICCINSVFTYYRDSDDKNNQNNKIILGINELEQALLKIKDSDLKIVLSHYPFENIIDFEKKDIQNLLIEKSNIVFLGHCHEDNYKQIIRLTSTILLSGRCLSDTNKFQKQIDNINGFSVIDYDNNTKKIRVTPKVYSFDRNEYVIDTMRCGDKQFYQEFDLSKNVDEIGFLHETCDYIKKNFLSYRNQDLIMFGTDTKAPCEINDIFVYPNVVQKKQDEDEVRKEKEITIEDIIENHKNFAIIGTQDSGKTIFLDKILDYYIEKVNVYQTIPIYIDCNNKLSNRIETNICQFAGIEIKKIEDYLKKYKFVLLFDNLDVRNINLVKKLKILIEKYPNNLKIIATVNTPVYFTIPINFLSSTIYDCFTIVFLKYFKKEQIMELVEKWFKKDNNYNFSENSDKIIHILNSFKLPRNPLLISMFLWILEKQENYQPLNQASMLENFIEKLFEKHLTKNVYYNEFDFTNKQHLLTAIAKKMFDLSNDNYAIKLSTLYDFCSKYFLDRKFAFDADKIIKEFIDVGLLTQYTDSSSLDVNIKFRFSCFFHYFLMKNMENEDFNRYVMNKDTYLSFVEEIILFTGIKRDCVKILKFVLDEMKKLFDDITKEIHNIHGSYDSFFSSNNIFIEKASFNFVGNIKKEKGNIKEDQKEMEEMFLEKIQPPLDIKKKCFDFCIIEKMEYNLKLAANILRNTEEIDEKDLKYNGYTSILSSFLSFECIYKAILDEVVDKKIEKSVEEKKEVYQLLTNFLPLFMSEILNETLHSNKLKMVFEEHIKKIINIPSFSDLEKFVSIFLYIDIVGAEGICYIKDFIEKINNKYMYDILFVKVMYLYFFKSKNDRDEFVFEELLYAIQTKIQNIKKKGISVSKKGACIVSNQQKNEFIKKLRERKKNKIK